MEYFAGIFDADGWVSLVPSGHFVIGLEMSNEKVINLFKEQFGGNLYIKTRDKRKTIYCWMIATGREKALNFIDKISPYTHIKTNQLNTLKEYLNQTRIDRRNNRPQFTKNIADLKKPIPFTREQFVPKECIIPGKAFWKWFAGFMDGDGNFTVYEYQNGKRRSFDSWISIFNTFGEPIQYVNHIVEGSISQYKGNKFPIWKWVCSQYNSEIVCQLLEPHLIIRKQQCRLVSEYLKIHKAKVRGVDHPEETVAVIRDIIKQIKYHNSL